MVSLKKINSNYANVLSWEKSTKNLQRIQSRLFKAVYVGDIKKALVLQKIILFSNSSRLLAIREVTQISLHKKLSGIDGKTFLTFTERFELNEYIKFNLNNWYPQSLKIISSLKKDGTSDLVKVPTISDRVWQCLVGFVINPAYEAVSHPNNFDFYSRESLVNLQKLILLNICENSNGYQKRILLISLERNLLSFNVNNLLKKLIAPRGIKLGIFRFLQKGLTPGFFEYDKELFNLNNTLANIILNGMEDLHYSIRCNSYLLFFLRPFDKEEIIVKKICKFFKFSQIDLPILNMKVYTPMDGFEFLDWKFKYSPNKGSYCTPSSSSYQNFLKRVKQIINNSNYGAVRVLQYQFIL